MGRFFKTTSYSICLGLEIEYVLVGDKLYLLNQFIVFYINKWDPDL